MADSEDININLNTNIPQQSDDAIKSVTGLKAAYKEAMDQMAAGSDGAGQRAADLQSRLEALKNETKSLKESGIEKLKSSMNLLQDGFINADPGKLGIAMKGLGTAMKTIPLFLIIEGIMYLVENFDKLSNSGGILGKVLGFIADVINAYIQALKDLADWLGLTNFAIQENADAQIEAAKKTEEATTSRYDAEIRLAKAAGKETFELEIKKQQAIIDSARIQFEAIRAVAMATGEVTKGQEEKVLALGKVIKDANLEIQVRQTEHQTAINKINQKAYEQNKTAKANSLAEQTKLADAALAQQKANDAAELASSLNLIAQVKKLKEDEELSLASSEEEKLAIIHQRQILEIEAEYEKSNKSIEAYQALVDAKLLIDNKYNNDLNTIRAETAAKKEAADKTDAEMQQVTASENLQLAQVSNDSMMALSDLYFAVKQANTKKGSAEEMKAAKQQFKINKALAITSAVISGIQGVVNALSASSVIPEPFQSILKVATAVGVGIAAAANIAKISATQFNAGGGGGAVSATVPSAVNSSAGAGGGSSTTPVAPSFSMFGNSTGNGTTNNASNQGSSNQQPTIKAYVVSQEITDQQTANRYSNSMGTL